MFTPDSALLGSGITSILNGFRCVKVRHEPRDSNWYCGTLALFSLAAILVFQCHKNRKRCQSTRQRLNSLRSRNWLSGSFQRKNRTPASHPSQSENSPPPPEVAPNLQGFLVLGGTGQLAEVADNCLNKCCFVVALQFFLKFSAQDGPPARFRN